jgi:5-methylcytosine-specific restriction protein B
MYKYYVKKVSTQDVERTTVINIDAARYFFNVEIPNRDDYDVIKIKYLPDQTIDDKVRIQKKQDIRIFIDRSRFKVGNLLLFEYLGVKTYSVKVINQYDHEYSSLNSSLNNGYMLTNNLIGLEDENISLEAINKYEALNKFPLNQILFGPPGTGKTDATVEMSLDILGLKTDDRLENREIFRSLLNKKIFFVTMHPSFSYEDFVEGIKPKTSEKGDLLFEPKDGIFKRIAESSLPYLFSYYFPGFLMSIYEEDVRKIIDPTMNQQQLLDFIGRKCNVAGGTIKNARDYFDNVVRTLSPRVGYSDEQFLANNIDKEFYVNLSKIYMRIPKNMLLNSFKNNWVNSSIVFTSQDKTESKYVLILDEINRANVSKVFGELITLLEEDKRIGKENELSVTLPSGEIFSVSPNLYIIGTMNTADKSIALVDIALRRRFQFIPVYPDSTIITKYCKSTDKADKAFFMDLLNTRLRVDKGVDFQIGHAYFLKDNSLADVVNENVIPLLTEYYRNDLNKVKKLLSDLGKSIDEDYYTQTGLLKYIG